MTERRKVEELPEIIPQEHGNKGYPVDVVKDAYRFSQMGMKTIAKRYGIKLALLEKYVKAGQWDKLREDHQVELYNTFAKEHQEILEQRQSLAHRLEMYKMIQMEEQLADLSEHYEKYGDSFARNSEGEIIRDGTGRPITRMMVSKDDVLILKDLQELRETNRRILTDTLVKQREEKTKRSIDILDADALIHGLKDE